MRIGGQWRLPHDLDNPLETRENRRIRWKCVDRDTLTSILNRWTDSTCNVSVRNGGSGDQDPNQDGAHRG